MRPARSTTDDDPGAGMLTRGQPAAVRAVRAMARRGFPHALLIVGPPSVGKTTLALDIGALLLCGASGSAVRPCRSCRACRLVAHGNHPDLHRLSPGGAGNQIRIAATPTDPRPGIRELTSELALSPLEGGARVALVEGAHRMNEDAQNALLKLLEEPPPGVHLILAADDEDRLLPTIRSRCARIRLGTVATREIERWLADLEIADPPTASRLARLAGGRPGIAHAYAVAPEVVMVRGEIDRGLLDLLSAAPTGRLSVVRGLLGRAAVLDAALVGGLVGAGPSSRGRRAPRQDADRAATASDAASADGAPIGSPAADPTADGSTTRSVPAAERRRAALALFDAWRDIALDLARAAQGDVRRLHDPTLLEEIVAIAGRIAPRSLADFLVRLDRAATAVLGNASPELAVDSLALAWPSIRPPRAA
ncbi:MAG: DNA polymerase III subunit [Chloroflexi bacterium]|nr:DNA polymerase III subunit [Chloroflexota bacterium]